LNSIRRIHSDRHTNQPQRKQRSRGTHQRHSCQGSLRFFVLVFRDQLASAGLEAIPNNQCSRRLTLGRGAGTRVDRAYINYIKNLLRIAKQPHPKLLQLDARPWRKDGRGRAGARATGRLPANNRSTHELLVRQQTVNVEFPKCAATPVRVVAPRVPIYTFPFATVGTVNFTAFPALSPDACELLHSSVETLAASMHGESRPRGSHP